MRISVVVPLLVAMVIAGASGCGKLPTWEELTAANSSPTPVTPAPVTPPSAPAVAPAAAVIPKGPTPEEVIAQFKSLLPARITDAEIIKLTSLSEGLEQITEINADLSPVTKDAFGSIERLTNLRQLRLNATRITDEACGQIGKVKSLEILALSGTGITDIGVAALTNLQNLKRLELSNVHLTHNGFHAIGLLPSLEELALSSTNLDNRGMMQICTSKSLTALYLNDNLFDDDGLSAIKKLTSLRVLEVSNSRIGGVSLQSAPKNLKVLSVYGCNLDDRGGKAIMQMKSLETLNLGNIPLLNDMALHNILKGMKDLKWLNLSKTKLLTGQGLDSLTSCQNIEDVYLDQCPLVGDVPTIAILKSLKNLKRVRLNGTAVSATGIQQLRSENSQLDIQ
jgi:internalin A